MKLTQADFKQRRDHLAQKMGANSVAIIATRAEMYRNRDADYKYRADSSFYYLTGFAEPEAVAVLETFAEGETYRYSLFCRERNREMEIWNGYRAGVEGAVEIYGADEAFAIDLLDQEIIAKLLNKDRLYFRIGHQAEFDARVSQWIQKADAQQRRGSTSPAEVIQLDRLIDEMRLKKSAQEIELMQIASNISADAHTRAMQSVKPEMMEYALEAELNYIFGKNGCVPAYNSIVGGGENACILHYVENNKPLKDGDLVLIDAACEYEFYASDITRTFPVNGKFSPEQKALYNIVLDAQLAAIDATRIGNHYKYPHEVAVKILTQGLVDLGLLSGNVNELVESEAFRQFFMHGTGHWLGMDVHDVGAYKHGEDWRAYEAGMVVTVEPGLYVAPDDETVDAKWRGIGIRIEDDIVVTENGPLVLTKNVVKTVEEIEQLMAS
ncbi:MULTISPECIES: Xaa-Pro aminopeptidase [Acinetobacter]|mgnify:FL=1|jgi:Xaa-Pro aminopeptidase|uniref:Xaa-Pro aminopeptidase n=1 Tax=Acinetobacter TaxID=469 RepID=UPI00057A9487|nr:MULTISPECIES: Xaa-Pro aminopeptidase [Acinetobacter]AWA47467.1 Xaa-Pro aminopeptidase [Acinetobacter junii]MDH1004580.1 Xaa-Pro aminopeptidase [Acinetobacter junii]MDH1858916.1 Xaa-Pro aminopeptidase [Acinetobacter junii]MDI6621280.1 Xaa-Pro aminopeptidase [Acinetobacter junii]MDU2407755.1 Xaa-Pro aminopeptidase [Acinetobacter junii]